MTALNKMAVALSRFQYTDVTFYISRCPGLFMLDMAARPIYTSCHVLPPIYEEGKSRARMCISECLSVILCLEVLGYRNVTVLWEATFRERCY